MTTADPGSAAAAGSPRDVSGPARLDRRGGRLLAQLRPGDVAVIDMIDIDLETARALVARRPSAVVNASPSTTGRAPGMGPLALHQAGIRLVDDVGSHLLALVDDGDAVTVTPDGQIHRGGHLLASGRIHDAGSLATAARQGRAGLTTQLAAFGACVSVVFEEERHLLLSPAPVEPAVTQTVEQFPPVLGTLLREGGRRQRRRADSVGRSPAVVVLPGPRALADARLVARFARGTGALVITAAEGARVATTARMRPDVVVGDGRELSERVLAGGAVAVHLAGPRTPDADITEARARLRRLGVAHAVWRTGLDPRDAAVVLAVSVDTAVVVLVGDRRGLLEFAEQKALGMAGSSLTRAAWGHRLVDASIARRLLRPPLHWAPALAVVALGVTSLVGALSLVASGADVAGGIADVTAAVRTAVEGLLGTEPPAGTP